MINDLINGDYFTYFVDLNAERTGNVFLNKPAKKPEPEPEPETVPEENKEKPK